MARRVNITLTEEEYAMLTMCYKAFIEKHDFTEHAPPSLTGYAAAALICSLRYIGDPSEKD